MARGNAAFMSGVPELLILRLLQRQSMYGYELVRAIRLSTDEAIVLAEGVVYPMLHSLEKRGLLSARRRTVEGRARVYYSITKKGQVHFDRLLDQWHNISGGINSCLEGQHG